MTSIPATDVRPGDLVDTVGAANPGPANPGPAIRVRDAATIDGVTYVFRRESDALVPEVYRFDASQYVTLYDRALVAA